MQSESVSLYFKEGSSDKEYHAQLEPHQGGWIVSFQYGRRGSALRADLKTPQPLPYAEAKKIYDFRRQPSRADRTLTGNSARRTNSP